MTLMNSLTDAIANPKQVRASQERASERLYAGLDRKRYTERDISPEALNALASGDGSSNSSRSASRVRLRPPSREAQALPSLRRPDLHRSQSEVPMLTETPRPKPEFTPCITATDLTTEQLKKTYSHDDLQTWDRSKYPLPPICAMKGKFRYRTAANADSGWRHEHFKKQLYGLDGLSSMVADLDMKDMTGIPNDEWQILAGGNGRRDSAVSSMGTRTASTSSLQDNHTDRPTGACVLRGFSPSRSSSTRSSFQSRKGSNLSVLNLAPETDASLFQKPLHRQSTISTSERRDSGLLSTINELPLNLPPGAAKKMIRLCEFPNAGDLDSAVASDAEDEDEAWSDVAEKQPDMVSAITHLLKDGKRPDSQIGLARVRTASSEKKRGRGSISMERTRTLRAHRPTFRKSRLKSKTHERNSSDEKKAKDDASDIPPAGSTDYDGSGLIIRIRKPIKNLSDQRRRQFGPVATKDDAPTAENLLAHEPRVPRK